MTSKFLIYNFCFRAICFTYQFIKILADRNQSELLKIVTMQEPKKKVSLFSKIMKERKEEAVQKEVFDVFPKIKKNPFYPFKGRLPEAD